MQSRHALRLLAPLLLLVSPVHAGAQTTYGDGVTVKEPTAFTLLLERPNTLEGQTVRIDGVISSVCTKSGCAWMGMTGAGGSDYGVPRLVRVDPAKIVFPQSAVGHRVSVQGTVQSVGRNPDPEAKRVAAEFAEDAGGSPPLWELYATGAVVE